MEPIKTMKQISFQPTNLNAPENNQNVGQLIINPSNDVDTTFKNIAESLSPEPEKLNKQSQVNEQMLQSKKMEL